MSERPLLSGIIPFQTFSTLEANMLKSFRKKRAELELIFVHDSNKELNQLEIGRLLETCEQSKYLFGNFGSPGAARNEGLKLAKGEWIAFWDSDDMVFPELILDFLEYNRNSTTKVGDFRIIQEGKELSSNKVGATTSTQSIVRFPGLWRFVFNRVHLGDKTFSNLLMGEDILYLVETKSLTSELEVIPSFIYEYRISPNQSTKKVSRELQQTIFVRDLYKVLISRQESGPIEYGILIRQLLSLLHVTRGRGLPVILKVLFDTFLFSSSSKKNVFIKGMVIAIRSNKVLL